MNTNDPKLTLFLDQMEFYRLHYLGTLKIRKEKAGDPFVARNKYLNEVSDHAKEAWRHLGNLCAEMAEAWKDDKEVTIASWVQNYIIEKNLNDEQIEDLGHYFGYEAFILEINGMTFFRTVEQAYIEAAHLGYINLSTSTNNDNEINDAESFENSSVDIRWNLGPTDFMRIVYGLHAAGKINDGNGEITNILRELARRWGIRDANWAQLLHNSKTNQKDSSHTAIFDVMKNAFVTYIKKEEEM